MAAGVADHDREPRGDRSMSHHYSGPDVSFPHGDARLDLTDPFPNPGGAGKSSPIMNFSRPYSGAFISFFSM
jgi:hypothetical protein